MQRLSTLSVSKMMFLLTASGFMVALFFAGPQLSGLWQERQKIQVDAKLTGLVSSIGSLTHELQKERGASAGFIASEGNSFADVLPTQRLASDEVIAEFLRSADEVGQLLPQDEPVLAQIEDVRKRIEALAALRKDVDDLKVGILDAVGSITALNRTAIAVLPELGKTISYANAARAVQRHAIFMTAKDISGLERATGATGYARAAMENGVFPQNILLRLNTLIQEQDVLFQIYAEIASEQLSEALETFSTMPATQKVKEMREIANSDNPAAILMIAPEDWFSGITEKINLIKSLEDQGVAELLSETSNALALSKTQIVETLALLFSLLVVVGVAASFLGRRVVSAISKTSDRISSLAAGDIESEIPNVAPADLKRITNALTVFQNSELERRHAEASQKELELSSAVGIKRVTKEVSDGDFSSRLRLRDLQGASKILGEGLNQIMSVAEEVVEQQSARDRKALNDQAAAARAGEKAVEELSEVVSACVAGDFSKRLRLEDKEGIFADLCEGVNRIGEVTETGLSDLTAVLDAIADGDLTKDMSERYEGAFAEISRKINRTSAELSKIVVQIAAGAQTVERSSAELSESADELAQRSDKATVALKETSTLVEELTKSVKSTAQRAKGLGCKAEATREETTVTMNSVSEMVIAMEGIAASSKEISQITSVIDDISFQTNLLALNAGVEAARAGEAGRGFSVVASEVRVLAQRAAEAAKDINELISNSETQVSAGVEIVGDSRSALKSIQQAISDMTTEVVHMGETASEQSASVTEVNNAVAQMENVTQRNSVMFEETNTVAQTMRTEASGLARAISHFSIDADIQALTAKTKIAS